MRSYAVRYARDPRSDGRGAGAIIDIPEKRAIISGIGISRIGRKTGIAGSDLTAESTRAAIADAGLTPADIDGIASLGDTPIDEVAALLGIAPTFTASDGFGRQGLLTPVADAAGAVAGGRARHVLVYRTVQMIGGTLDSGPDRGQAMPKVLLDVIPLMTFNAFSAANWLGLHCHRHMHLYGTTKEQLGWLAVTSRRHAGLNPRAVFRDPMTLDDYLRARPISSPFGLYDCDVPIDGSIAFVVSTADHAADCPQPPVRFEAIGGSDGDGGWFHRPDFPKMASVDAAAEMWARTDLTPADLDVAQLYDGFTYITFAWLEALGICGDGEAGPFVEGGTRIALDGQLPLNTYGGQLSAGRMHGYWVLHEACVQLRGEGGERQVAGDPEVAVAAAGGGPIAGCMLLTRG
ncbi:MAG TPA: thiolase family protein [Acidimicrobiales bacterium]|nr:thiolase family protein [Acidimicrobiales bacterium]